MQTKVELVGLIAEKSELVHDDERYGDAYSEYDDLPYDEEDFSDQYIETADGGPYYAEVVCPCRFGRDGPWCVGPGEEG
jgi:hypothetical protein